MSLKIILMNIQRPRTIMRAKKILILVTLLFFSAITPVRTMTTKISDANVYAPKIIASKTPTIDGTIDQIWDEASSLALNTEWGTNGYVKFLHDSINLYTLAVFESSLTWVSIIWADGSCMPTDVDLWEFGHDAPQTDYYSSGNTMPTGDGIDDIKAATATLGSEKVVELRRALITNDTAGFDVNFVVGEPLPFLVGSSSAHYSDYGQYNLELVTGTTPTTNPGGPNNNDSEDEIEFADFVLVISLSLTLVTIAIHMVIRVFIRPIKHEERLISSEPPVSSKGETSIDNN